MENIHATQHLSKLTIFSLSVSAHFLSPVGCACVLMVFVRVCQFALPNKPGYTHAATRTEV